MNVNSLLSKIDEIRDIANRIKPAVLGITESKLGSSVTNMEVNINGYSIIRNDRNRHGGGVACYVKNDLCFNNKKFFPNSIEHVFFEILIPKVKPIAVGIFYRPPNSNDFLNLLSNSFQQIDLNKKEIYLLGDFNINLFQNGKFLLKENQSNQVKDPTSSLISKYKEFCQSFKKSKKSNLHIDYDFYIEAKYNVQKLIKQKKIEFYNAKLRENIAKPKELWKPLKNLGLPSKKSPSMSTCLTKDNTTIFADKENTNIFKKFYSTLADDLVKNLPPASSIFGLSSVCQYYNKTLKLPNTRFKFPFVSEDSVLKILKNMDENKAAGLDNLSGNFLKNGATILAKPLSQICNLSIKYSTFPNDCKIAKLKPLFKRGSKTDPKNYRPISLLPLISKVIEKIVHDQTHFLDKNNVIYRYQSGFRKFYSTDSCLSYLNNKIATGFESGLFTGMILIGVQKAFDTINHDILIKK